MLVRLLLGEIPEHQDFTQPGLRKPLQAYYELAQAVRGGDLGLFRYHTSVGPSNPFPVFTYPNEGHSCHQPSYVCYHHCAGHCISWSALYGSHQINNVKSKARYKYCSHVAHNPFRQALTELQQQTGTNAVQQMPSLSCCHRYCSVALTSPFAVTVSVAVLVFVAVTVLVAVTVFVAVTVLVAVTVAGGQQRGMTRSLQRTGPPTSSRGCATMSSEQGCAESAWPTAAFPLLTWLPSWDWQTWRTQSALWPKPSGVPRLLTHVCCLCFSHS